VKGRGIALALLLWSACDTAALPDPTAPGPHAVATTTIPITAGESRTLEAAVWYPVGKRGGTASGKHPLLVFSHGLCGLPTSATFLCEALASFGVIVIAPPHPASQLGPDCLAGVATSFAERPGEVRAAIDAMLAAGSPFARRIRRGRIGIAGHSFGGQTAIRVAAADPRIRVAAAFAPAFYGPAVAGLAPEVPTVVMVGALDTFAPPDTQAWPYYALLRGPRLFVQIANTGHFAFSDRCTFGMGRPDCGPGTLSQSEAHAHVLRVAVPFLLRHLTGRRAWGRLSSARGLPADLATSLTVRSSRRPRCSGTRAPDRRCRRRQDALRRPRRRGALQTSIARPGRRSRSAERGRCAAPRRGGRQGGAAVVQICAGLRPLTD